MTTFSLPLQPTVRAATAELGAFVSNANHPCRVSCSKVYLELLPCFRYCTLGRLPMRQKPAKKPTKKSKAKTTNKVAAKTTSMATTIRCPDSERAKVPGIVVALKDMENPCVLAEMNGVPITRLRARQVIDGATGRSVNTF